MAMIEASRPSTSPSASTRCQARVTSAGFMDTVFMISGEPLVGWKSAAEYRDNRPDVNEKERPSRNLAVRYHNTTIQLPTGPKAARQPTFPWLRPRAAPA